MATLVRYFNLEDGRVAVKNYYLTNGVVCRLLTRMGPWKVGVLNG